TNAVPYLVRWIRYERPRWKDKAFTAINPVLGRINSAWQLTDQKTQERADGAARALGALGPKAQEAVPKLALMMNNTSAPNSALRAESALSALSHDLVTADMALMTNGSAGVRLKGVDGLYYVGRDLTPAVPVLVQLLQDGTEAVAAAAA